MQSGIAQSLSQRRLTLSLVAGFGAIALLLACIGIYRVLTYSVIERRREIAICRPWVPRAQVPSNSSSSNPAAWSS